MSILGRLFLHDHVQTLQVPEQHPILLVFVFRQSVVQAKSEVIGVVFRPFGVGTLICIAVRRLDEIRQLTNERNEL